MRILILLLILASISFTISAQNHNKLDGNNWSVRFNANMSQGWDLKGSSQTYNRSLDSISSLFAFSLWIGGIDAKGEVYAMAETYHQAGGNDNAHGPLTSDTTAIQDTNRLNYWDQVFKINREDIEGLRTQQTIHDRIKNWPGNGDAKHSEPKQIAPYVDTDKDGVYDPTKGDYPNMKGHQMLFQVNNDHVTKTQTGSEIMDLEITTMPYVFNCRNDEVLNNTFFVDYEIVNKSARTYDSVYIGQFVDIGLGFPYDDYIATVVDQNAMLVVNSNDTDAWFGANPPVQATYLLSHSLSKTIYYTNDFGNTGNPNQKGHFYNYLSGRWKNDSCLKYGGDGHYRSTSNCTDYIFPGDPRDTSEWSEWNSDMLPGDRRVVMSTGPLTLKPGEKTVFTIAYSTHRAKTGKVLDSYDLAIKEMQHVQDLYKADQLANPCTWVSAPEVPRMKDVLRVYPNPANSYLRIDLGDIKGSGTLQVVSTDGRVVSKRDVRENERALSMDISSLPAGIYFLKFAGKSHNARTFLEVLR